VITGILLSILTSLAAAEITAINPWCAKKLVRWSARRRYADNQARAKIRAEELEAFIDARPGNLLKLMTAAAFAAAAVAGMTRKRARRPTRVHSGRRVRRLGAQVAGLASIVGGLGFIASGGASLANGTTAIAQLTMAGSDGLFLIAVGMVAIGKCETLATLIAQLSCASWSIGGYFTWHSHLWAPVLLVYAVACAVLFLFGAMGDSGARKQDRTQAKGADSTSAT
jgi:hypothetical protein